MSRENSNDKIRKNISNFTYIEKFTWFLTSGKLLEDVDEVNAFEDIYKHLQDRKHVKLVVESTVDYFVKGVTFKEALLKALDRWNI